MRIALDSTVLLYLLYPDAPAPLDPATGKSVTEPRVRIEGLLDELDNRESLIILPTPVLSELLIKAESRQAEILAALMGKRSLLVASFDAQAAVENAAMRRTGKLNRKSGTQTKNELRFDLQILAIARVNGAQVMYTDDGNLRTRCAQLKMPVKGIADLPIPDSHRQIPMALPTARKEDSGTLAIGHESP